jgi:ankyrin repeat protein
MKKLLFIISASLLMSNLCAGKGASLKDAVMGQNFELTKKALDDGADANESWSSAPALYWAAIQGRSDVIKLLIEKGAKVDGTGLMGMTPLDGVIEHPKTPEELVAENVKLNEKILKHFSEEQAREKGWYKETNIKVFSTVAERVKMLIDAGADPNFLLGNMTVKEMTPFLYVVEKGQLDLVKIMLDTKKTDPEFRFHQWSEGVVSFVSYVDVGKYEKGDRTNVQKWSNVPKFNTPLLYAIENKDLALVKLLIEGGAQVNNGKKVVKTETITEIDHKTTTTTFYYKGPLDIALDNGYSEIADYLKSKGAIQYQQ